jgi:hypothetical protein
MLSERNNSMTKHIGTKSRKESRSKQSLRGNAQLVGYAKISTYHVDDIFQEGKH